MTDRIEYQRQSFVETDSDISVGCHLQSRVCVCVCSEHRPGVLEEIIHNLDYCDVLVLGEELMPEQESLQLQRNALLGKHLDATNSTSGMSIYGRSTKRS